MVITTSVRCPTRAGLEGVDRPEVRDAVVGAEGLYGACVQDGFSRRREVSLLHAVAGWAGVLEWRRTTIEIVPLREDCFFNVLFRLRRETRIDPAEHYGIEHEAVEDALTM